MIIPAQGSNIFDFNISEKINKDNAIDKVILYQSAQELNELNEYAKKTIKEIEPQYFFDILQVLLDANHRKDMQIIELEEKLDELEEKYEECKKENC